MKLILFAYLPVDPAQPNELNIALDPDEYVEMIGHDICLKVGKIAEYDPAHLIWRTGLYNSATAQFEYDGWLWKRVYISP